ncbi:MAG: glycosyltransferase family 2 protein [Winogradskyella sp.]|uniref:glycosyltransferase family 2 protein n=1 Tax=Winogradskyella sp. TaxID=1883156 RepID=UPI000F3D10C8|nr:glycosyltransferase family 2 protein [Winogradskyella sp.]RNC86883.1 MAG: glycosyltransferase family 2 protein [Winogradskyella sp.]
MSIITILLPVYNGEKTLKATLESLLSQTYKDFEIIIGIDGTKDKSKAIALAFNDPRIRIIEHPQNLGLANNLNALIKCAHQSTKYFAMAEQDDIYVSERLEWQVEIMEAHSDVGLVSGISEFQSDSGNVLFPGILVYGKQFPSGLELFKHLYIHQLKVVNTCMLWRKSVHQKNKLTFNNTYGNFNVDWDFVLRFSLIRKIHGVPKVLVKMNRHKNNESVTKNRKQQHLASRRLLKDFRKEFPNLLSKNTYHKAIKNHCKIELGHYKKPELFFKSIYYTIVFRDLYFLRYFMFAFKKALKAKTH